jgi:hypothetical protein
MKKLIAPIITIGTGLTLTLALPPTPAQVDPYLNNSIPSPTHQVFNPWTGQVDPQTLTNQPAIALASGYGFTVCYGSRTDETWSVGGIGSTSASAWQTSNGRCDGPLIHDWITVSTAPVFNDQSLGFRNGCTATGSDSTVASAWKVSVNCGRYGFGIWPPYDVYPERGWYRQFTCVTTPRWSGCHSPVGHWVY